MAGFWKYTGTKFQLAGPDTSKLRDALIDSCLSWSAEHKDRRRIYLDSVWDICTRYDGAVPRRQLSTLCTIYVQIIGLHALNATRIQLYSSATVRLKTHGVENRRRFSIPIFGVENRRRFSTSKIGAGFWLWKQTWSKKDDDDAVAAAMHSYNCKS